MIRTALITAIAAFGCSLSSSQAAGFMTAQQLVLACKADMDSPERQKCYSYLEGALDGMEFARVDGPKGKICLPNEVTLEEIRLAYLRLAPEFISAFQAIGDMSAALVLEKVSTSAFPCN